MSAFMHDSAHIDALVHAGIRFASHDLSWNHPTETVENEYWGKLPRRMTLARFDREAATRIGRILLRENAASVCHRYNMDDLDNDADGGTRPMEYLGYLAQADDYSYDANDTGKPWRMLPAVAYLKALSSYEYQSCEHDGWETSEAKAFCDALRYALIGALPGYDAADTWTIYPKEGQPA